LTVKRKYTNPYNGKPVTAQQFLAAVVIYNKEANQLGPMGKSACRSQYVAAAKIVKEFSDCIEDVMKIVAKDKMTSLFPLIWKEFTPLHRRIRKLEKERSSSKIPKRRNYKAPYLGGEISKL